MPLQEVVMVEIEKLKKEINNTNIPFDHSNYFVKKAEEELGWKAKLTLEDMCKDSWRYIQKQMEE